MEEEEDEQQRHGIEYSCPGFPGGEEPNGFQGRKGAEAGEEEEPFEYLGKGKGGAEWGEEE